MQPVKIIGFFSSLIDNPRLYIAIISLSLSNFKNDKTSPNISINGNVTFNKLGISHKDKLKILRKLIWRLFIMENNLDNCINQAIDIKIKKTSVQDLII